MNQGQAELFLLAYLSVAGIFSYFLLEMKSG